MHYTFQKALANSYKLNLIELKKYADKRWLYIISLAATNSLPTLHDAFFGHIPSLTFFLNESKQDKFARFCWNLHVERKKKVRQK